VSVEIVAGCRSWSQRQRHCWLMLCLMIHGLMHSLSASLQETSFGFVHSRHVDQCATYFMIMMMMTMTMIIITWLPIAN